MRLRFAPLTAIAFCFFVLVTADTTRAASSAELQRAEKQFKRSCGTCHTVDTRAPQRQGPNLFEVIGRRAGGDAKFSKYSDALKAAGEASSFASTVAWTFLPSGFVIVSVVRWLA